MRKHFSFFDLLFLLPVPFAVGAIEEGCQEELLGGLSDAGLGS